MAQEKFSVAIRSDAYQKLINNTLGDKEIARTFVAEISTVVAQNKQLQQCDAGTILSAGLLAQTLKLSLAPSLGLGYVLPYKTKDGYKAQFQLGYKGLIQLAQRSGQFERLGSRVVHEGEYIGQDEFGDDLFKFSHEYDDKPVVGYYAYFKLNNGFKKTFYMTKEQAKAHGKRYSRSYGNGKGTDLWTTDFDVMAQKTVLKLLLNRYAPLSVDLQKAIQSDQAVINTDGTYNYVDNATNDNVEDEPKKRTTVKNTILPQEPEEEETTIEYDEETGEVVGQSGNEKSKEETASTTTTTSTTTSEDKSNVDDNEPSDFD